MNFKKFLSIFFIISLISVPLKTFADDMIEVEDIYSGLELKASNDSSDAPNINARHAIILDRNSNITLFGKNENEKCKMASTTKIMTAIVVLENCTDLNAIVTVSKKAARYWWFKAWFVF